MVMFDFTAKKYHLILTTGKLIENYVNLPPMTLNQHLGISHEKINLTNPKVVYCDKKCVL